MDEEIEIEIQKALKILKSGGVILYPTDTVWGLGCDALNVRAINKVYRIKQRPVSKSLIVLLDSFENLEKYVAQVPDIVEDLIGNIEKPVTIIYDHARNLPKNLISSAGTVAIRVVKNEFCRQLIKELGRPLISSSANISGETTPLVFSQISKRIIDQVDYVVELSHDQFNQAKASTIIRIYASGAYEIIRD